jgi:pilus assembly protein CpaE
VSNLKAIVALEDGLSADSVEDALVDGDDLRIVGFLESGNGDRSILRRSGVDLVLIACEPGSASALDTIHQAVAEAPERPVVVLQLGAPSSNGFMNDVFAAGADDIIALPETPERMRHALQKAIARKRGAGLGDGGTPGQLVCILGPKGGTGKTITACNLSVALAEAGRRTTLVDLDLRFGDVGLGLRLSPQPTIYDLAKVGGTLDAEKMEDYLVTHESGLRVLLAPTRPDHAGAVSTAFIAEVYAVLRSAGDAVVVDTPAGFAPEVITSIDSSTDVCVVGMLDAFSLKDTKLGLETLDRMGYDGEGVRLVLNRADTHVGITDTDVKAILGRTPDILIPSEQDIPRSVTEGIPIVSSQPRSAAAKAFRTLAEMYTNVPAVAVADMPAEGTKTRSRKSLLRR